MTNGETPIVPSYQEHNLNDILAAFIKSFTYPPNIEVKSVDWFLMQGRQGRQGEQKVLLKFHTKQKSDNVIVLP